MEKEKAIEIFNKWLDCKDAYQADPSCDGNCFSCEYYASAEEEKEAMQTAISALEKQEAIKSCTPPSDDWEHYADRLHDIAYQSGYEQGKRDAEQDRWIPVTERLPEKEGCYLVTVQNDYKRKYSKTAWYSGDGWFARQDIIAWRLTPEPYTEEDNDKS